uniref:Reverse transcriptase zinc-binding domain-containing protein n=1 Tax=Chenopodium quinoa TaxID=63459 RepID=A0A803MEX5_CHEQI
MRCTTALAWCTPPILSSKVSQNLSNCRDGKISGVGDPTLVREQKLKIGTVRLPCLIEGLRWRVGNGSNIKVWSDKWLPGSVIPLPNPNANYRPDLTVAELIDQNSGVWNVNVVEEFFQPAVCQSILPVFEFTFYEMFWQPTKNGIYTVKSGAPKLAHFVWQACKGHKEILFRRHITQDELCACGLEVEYINHVLFECDSARMVWGNSEYDETIVASPSGSFSSKLLWFASKVDIKEVNSIMSLAG